MLQYRYLNNSSVHYLDGFLHDYVRITGSCPLAIAGVLQIEVETCGSVCAVSKHEVHMRSMDTDLDTHRTAKRTRSCGRAGRFLHDTDSHRLFFFIYISYTLSHLHQSHTRISFVCIAQAAAKDPASCIAINYSPWCVVPLHQDSLLCDLVLLFLPFIITC